MATPDDLMAALFDEQIDRELAEEDVADELARFSPADDHGDDEMHASHGDYDTEREREDVLFGGPLEETER